MSEAPCHSNLTRCGATSLLLCAGNGPLFSRACFLLLFCLNQMRPQLKAIQPKQIHSKVGFKLKPCKHSNSMYNTFQKTQKITFTSNKVSIIDVVHRLRPCEAEKRGSPLEGGVSARLVKDVLGAWKTFGLNCFCVQTFRRRRGGGETEPFSSPRG